jgi:hypothetical protein
MMRTGGSRANSPTDSDAVIRQRSTRRRSKINSMIALVGVIMPCVAEAQTATAGKGGAAAVSPAASAPGQDAPYGWNPTNAGDPRYEKYGPGELTDQRQLNERIGEAAAERIARGLRLDKSKTFTEGQYILFVTGKEPRNNNLNT